MTEMDCIFMGASLKGADVLSCRHDEGRGSKSQSCTMARTHYRLI